MNSKNSGNRASKLFECVANVSEGVRLHVIDALAAEIAEAGASVLHRDSHPSANRTVLTFVGDESVISSASLRLIAASKKLIDMTSHWGNHPCVGAVDILPIVPLFDSTIQEAKEIAISIATSAWKEFGVSSLFYGLLSQTACFPSEFRKGGLAELRKRVETGAIKLDVGDEISDTFGVMLVTARPIMIAYNVNLDSKDVAVAKEIAKLIRDRRKSLEALSSVKALGWYVEDYGCAQVSFNLYDYKTFGMADACQLVRELALTIDQAVSGSELVGLAPEDAFPDSVEKSVELLGLDSKRAFLTEVQVIERAIKRAGL